MVEVSVGGSHSLLLDSEGKVYSWGLADEGQLGRHNKDSQIHQVSLIVAIDLITCGDSFSLAVNTHHSLIYFWGGFRNN